jgi:hypothetical protein
MDIRVLKEFVAEVLVICKNDDTGVSIDLLEPALTAGLELGMTREELEKIIDEA